MPFILSPAKNPPFTKTAVLNINAQNGFKTCGKTFEHSIHAKVTFLFQQTCAQRSLFQTSTEDLFILSAYFDYVPRS
jgi:hypothetical protein